VVTSSTGCATTSAAATVTINTPPSIGTQPQSVSTCTGTATLQVIATGTSLTYQWHSGAVGSGTPVSGAISPSYNAPAGTYYCAVSGNGCTVNSTAATVTPNSGPTISGPQSVTICSGTTQLSVTAAGATSYQWFNASTSQEITGAISSSYTASAGSYYCIVRNSANCASQSATATVTISTPPTISSQPQSATLCSGTTQLSVTASGATGYQWYRGGTAISGATSSTYNASAGSYYCIVTNSNNCSTQSTTATVTVRPALTISIQPVSMVWDCNMSSRGVFSVAATGGSGSGNYTYQWYYNTNGGTTGTPLTDDPRYVSGSRTSQLTLVPDVQRYVWCVVSDVNCPSLSATTNHVVHDLYNCTHMTITRQPVGVVWDCDMQSRGVFTVAVSGGSGNYSYQWYSNTDGGATGSPISESRYATGVTTATLTLVPNMSQWVWCEIYDLTAGTITTNHVLMDVSRCP
jgi:hypothetical protein